MRSEREEPSLGPQRTWRAEEHQHYMPASGLGVLQWEAASWARSHLGLGFFLENI